ncbi:(2Fe-2S)-binding protein [Solirubrobacter phytolaccae]|uniref:(2Fe-2S)-binding protein n=1 Tax=Solirubrobacter phytolaccae TaxID=1404360 RepID=A0A9X3NAB0_9ACTN|nr:(2Fe-2S)-binding protein [Solirubrobacter phytolaccae]MDA0182311.1 (2Fe-2S)-binding protein [Solirubrobacter phytolaccae]
MAQGLHVGARAEAGWTTSADLAGAGLERALAIVGRQLNTDRLDIQGQRIVEVVAWWLGLPAAHALLDDDRLPDLSPENTRVWVHEDEAPDGIGTLVLEERYQPASLSQLDAYVEAHVGELIDAVCAHTKRPAKALRRGVADRVAGALIWAAQTRGDEPRGCALAKRAYEDIDLRTLELPGYALTVHVRSGCCLYYRIPDKPKCWGCPLLTDDERRALTSNA